MSKLRPNDIWEFGKYKGKTIESLPRDYLKWVVANFRKGQWRDAAKRQLEMFEFEPTDDERFVQGRMDCSDRFDPSTPTNLEPWDGFNPPFDLDKNTSFPVTVVPVVLPKAVRNLELDWQDQELFVGVS